MSTDAVIVLMSTCAAIWSGISFGTAKRELYRTTTYSPQVPFAGKNATRWPSLNLFAAFGFVPSRRIVPTPSSPGFRGSEILYETEGCSREELSECNHSDPFQKPEQMQTPLHRRSLTCNGT